MHTKVKTPFDNFIEKLTSLKFPIIAKCFISNQIVLLENLQEFLEFVDGRKDEISNDNKLNKDFNILDNNIFEVTFQKGDVINEVFQMPTTIANNLIWKERKKDLYVFLWKDGSNHFWGYNTIANGDYFFKKELDILEENFKIKLEC